MKSGEQRISLTLYPTNFSCLFLFRSGFLQSLLCSSSCLLCIQPSTIYRKLKAADRFLSQLEGEEEEEEEGGEEEEDEEVDEMCRICLKDKEHWWFECPYLERIKNPLEATTGKGYYIVCAQCDSRGHSDAVGKKCDSWNGNPNNRWIGRAVVMFVS